MDMEIPKKYAVLEFMYKNTIFVSAAPKKWINGSTCMWPKKEKERKAIKEAHEPQVDWAVMEKIKIMGEYSTYKEAMYYEERFAKANTDDEISDFNDKDYSDTVKLGKRKSRPTAKYRDSSISPPPVLEIQQETPLPIMSSPGDSQFNNNAFLNSCDNAIIIGDDKSGTKLVTKSGNSAKIMIEEVPYRESGFGSVVKSRKNEQLIIEEDSNESGSMSKFDNTESTINSEIGISNEVNNVNKEDVTDLKFGRTQNNTELEILATLITINERLAVIEHKLINIEKTLSLRVALKPFNGDNDIAKMFPLKNLDCLQELEMQLFENEENKGKLMEFLQYVGGATEKNCITRSIEKLFTNHCAMFCSWTGKKGNFKIKDLILIEILKAAVRVTYPNVRDDLFEKTIMQWLQFAKVRHDRGKQ